MVRISLEEAKQYIPYIDDYTGDKPHFFTLYACDDGWDIVKYFTNKKRGIFYGKEGDEWVYILTNKAMPGLAKIGYTKIDPFNRAMQVSRGTGVPLGFDVEWAYKCFKGERIEKEVHKYFKKYRVAPNREFFKVSVEEVKKIIEVIGNKYI